MMFFVHTDYSQEIQKAKIHLAQPNKKIISHLFERYEVNLSVKLGNIYELTFSIPHFINDEYEMKKNPHVNIMKEKMLLRVSLSGVSEWFIIDAIEEDGSDTDVFNVTAFSLGYELAHKRISSYVGEGVSCKAMATDILQPTTWEVGTIDQEIQYRTAELTDENEVKRTLEINGSNRLDAILQIAEAFGAVPIFDGENKTISFKVLNGIGTYKGMSIDYGRLLKHINRSRTTDELVTRMYAFGNDDLTIAGVNPTGQMYIEDFSFFMYPFERGADKKRIKSSYFMSDELCHAILNHKELVQKYSTEINALMKGILERQLELQTEKTNLTELRLELQNINYRLDTAKASEDQSLISQIESERIAKQAELTAQETLVANMESSILKDEVRIDTLRNSIASEAGFTTALYDELNYYIIEKEWRDDRYIDATELYEDALKRFVSLREPKVVLTVDIENLFEVIDEQYYWDKLELGDLIKIRYPQMSIEYMAQIIEINYDFENGSISIVIANTEKVGNEMDRLKELLSKSQSASTILENNKYKWNKVVDVEDEVYRLINGEWDANKRKIVAGVNNQIEIGNRGIIIRNPDSPKEVVIMQAGIIALSKDDGNTWKTAIKPDGIVAERVIGNLIAGRNLIITNGSKTFTVDEDGVKIIGASLEITGGLPVSQIDQDYVNSVNNEITEAQEAIDSLTRELKFMFEDNKITELESRTLELSLKRAISESKDIISIATELAITVENTNYKNALTALETYLNGKYINKTLYPITVTVTDRTEIDTKFATVEDKKSILINAISKRREENANKYTLNLISEVNKDIEELGTELNNLDGYIEGSFRDGVIEVSEAQTIGSYINTLNVEKVDIDSKYTQIHGSVYLVDTTVKNSLATAKTAYNTAHANLISAINTAISDSKATLTEKQNVDSKFTAYRTAVATLSTSFEKAINAIGSESSRLAEQNAKAYTDAMKVSIDAEMDDVLGQLDDLSVYVGDSFRDGIIEESEAQSIGIYINTLSTEKADIDNKYTQVYGNANLVNTTIKTALLNAKTAYNTTHTNLTTSINNAISDRKATLAEKADVDTKFGLYKTAMANLSTAFEKAVDAIGQAGAKNAEDNAKTYVDTMKTSIDAEMREVTGRLDSLNKYVGDSFRDGIIEESEAQTIGSYINSLNVEKADLDNKYTQVYGNANLVDTTIKSGLSTSKTAYNTAHTNLITSINTAISDRRTTATEKADVDTKFELYKTATANLTTSFEKAVNAIGLESAKKAENNANAYTDTMKTNIDKEITDVVGRLDGLNKYVGESFRDGVIEESEAQTIGVYLNSLTTEKADLDNRYTFVYANSSLVDATIKSGLLNAKNTYNTAHTNLLTSINTAISDGKATKGEKADVDVKFEAYKTALASLSTAFENAIDAIGIEKARVAESNAKNASVGKGEVLNGVKIDAQNGMVVTTSDNKTKVTTNATKGFLIQKNIGTTLSPNYSDVLSIDTGGNVVLKSGVITWGDVNAPSALQTGALPSDSKIITKLTADGVYTGTVTTNQLVAGTAKISTAMIESLVVGGNVTMGSNAYISWGNITSRPSIPTSAGEIGAMSSTYVDAYGVWTGYINADRITGGTISGRTISGGTVTGTYISGGTISGSTISGASISGGSIDVTTDVSIGNTLLIGTQSTASNKYIKLSSGAIISGNGFANIRISANNTTIGDGVVDFSSATTIYWGNHAPTAKFG